MSKAPLLTVMESVSPAITCLREQGYRVEAFADAHTGVVSLCVLVHTERELTEEEAADAITRALRQALLSSKFAAN